MRAGNRMQVDGSATPLPYASSQTGEDDMERLGRRLSRASWLLCALAAATWVYAFANDFRGETLARFGFASAGLGAVAIALGARSVRSSRNKNSAILAVMCSLIIVVLSALFIIPR